MLHVGYHQRENNPSEMQEPGERMVGSGNGRELDPIKRMLAWQITTPTSGNNRHWIPWRQGVREG